MVIDISLARLCSNPGHSSTLYAIPLYLYHCLTSSFHASSLDLAASKPSVDCEIAASRSLLSYLPGGIARPP